MEQPIIIVLDSKRGAATAYASFETAYDELSAKHDLPAIMQIGTSKFQVHVSEYKDLSDRAVLVHIYDGEFETREAASEAALNECECLTLIQRGPLCDELLEI